MHVQAKPAILYFGTPVVLISTRNEDDSYNIAPMSSVFWLGWRCVIGLSAAGKTAENLLRSRECVLNLPSEDQVAAVDALALTTGSNPVPAFKAARGYRYVREKFDRAGLTPQASNSVRAPRIRECPVQLEAALATSHELAEDDASIRGQVRVFELVVKRVHVDDTLLLQGHEHRIDPDKWRPLLMSFQHFYGLSARKLQSSKLSSIDEDLYRKRSGKASCPRTAPESDN